jgi:hypothetical protein
MRTLVGTSVVPGRGNMLRLKMPDWSGEQARAGGAANQPKMARSEAVTTKR